MKIILKSNFLKFIGSKMGRPPKSVQKVHIFVHFFSHFSGVKEKTKNLKNDEKNRLACFRGGKNGRFFKNRVFYVMSFSAVRASQTQCTRITNCAPGEPIYFARKKIPECSRFLPRFWPFFGHVFS